MKNYIKFIIAMLIFGSIGVFVKNVPLSSAEIVVSRTIIGGSILLVTMFITNKRFSLKNIINNRVPLIVSGLVLGLNWAFLFESFKYTSVSIAILLYYSAPIMVMILSPFVLKESLNFRKIFGILMAMFGMVLVNKIGSTTDSSFLGIIFAITAALFYTILILANKKIKNMGSIEITVIQLIIATVVLFPYAIFTHQGPWVAPSGFAMVSVITLGIVHTGLACLLYFSSVNKLPAQSIALFSYIDPLSALVFSAIFLNEQLTIIQSIGAFLILFGAVYGEVKPTKKQPASN